MNWKNMPALHKIVTVIAGLAVLVWVLAHVVPALFPVDPSYIAVAVFTLCEAVVFWKEKRMWACLLIAAAVISTACFIWGLSL